MVLVLLDRAVQTTTTSGTTALVTLTTTVLSYAPLYQAGRIVIDDDTFPYVMWHVNTALQEWEVGVGVLRSSSTFERLSVSSSSNNNAPVNFSSGIKYVANDASAAVITQALEGGGGIGSVGLALPAEFTVTNSPLTEDGTITAEWAEQPQNRVFASPNGSAGVPMFRALVAADIPALDYIPVGDIDSLPYIPIADINNLPYLTSVAFADLTSKAHSHQNAAGGGTLTTDAIGSGTFADSFIPNLATSKITSGTFDNARINWASPPAIGTGTPANGTFAAIVGTTGAFSGNLTLSGAPGKIKPAVDSTTALQIANAAGTSYVHFDTTNGRMGVGVVPTTTFQVSGSAEFIGAAMNLTNNSAASPPAQFVLRGLSDSNKQLLFGYNTTSQYGSIQAIWQGNSASPLALNGLGGFVGVGTSGPSTTFHTLVTNTASAITTNVVTIERASTGAGVAGYGAGMVFALKSSATANRSAALIETIWNVATDAAAVPDLVLSAYHNAAGTLTKREGFRVRGGASATEWAIAGGTVGATASVTGSRGGNAALADLLTKLAAKGIIIDGSSA